MPADERASAADPCGWLPGFTAFTCTPSAAPVSASDFVKESSAQFTDPPTANAAPGTVQPAMPAIFNTDPWAALRCGHAARVSRTAPKNFRANPSVQILFGQGEELAALGGPRVVHHDVQPAKPGQGEVHQAARRTRPAKVQGDRVRLSAGGLDFAHNAVEGRGVARARMHRVPRSPLERDRPADTAARTGDNGYFSFERVHWRAIPSMTTFGIPSF